MRISIVAICLVLLILPAVATQAQANPTPSPSAKKELSLRATGPFEVKIYPRAPDEKAGGAAIGRMLIDKQFHGDLEATSKGTMLAAGTGAKNSSGGYVALEIVTGALKGRTGTFVLQHSATMTRGVPTLSITVVPDSGTGQLTGLVGKMNVNITGGKHSYELEYALPQNP